MLSHLMGLGWAAAARAARDAGVVVGVPPALRAEQCMMSVWGIVAPGSLLCFG